MALARRIRWVSPPESRPSGRDIKPARPALASNASMRARVGAAIPRQTGRRWRERARNSPVVSGSVRSTTKRCGTKPMCSFPRQWKRIRPANSICPSTAAMSVLLPAPFGPTTTVMEPGTRASETRSSRSCSPASDREIDDFEEGRGAAAHGPVAPFGSCTSARIITSTLRCISRSNSSAAYAPRAMWLMT